MTDRSLKNTAEREILLNRTFDAPRELVFDAFTEPGKIGQWWGPDGFTTTTESMSFETGGEWVFTMHGPDGTDYPNRILYTGIKSPEYLKYDHYGHKDGEDDPPHFKATIIFEESGDKTRVTLRMLFPTAEARSNAAEFGAIEGGKQTLGRLAVFLGKHSN